MPRLVEAPSVGFGEELDARHTTPACFYRAKLQHLYEVAEAARSGGTVGGPTLDDQSRTVTLTSVDPELSAAASDSPALRAVEQIRGWLNLSYDAAARVAGFQSASLIYHWRRQHRDGKPVRPRPSSIARLLRIHASLRAVAEALDGTEAGYGTQLWARSDQGGTSPLDLLLDDDVEGFEAAARRLLMDQSARALPSWQYAQPESDLDLDMPAAGTAGEYGEADFG